MAAELPPSSFSRRQRWSVGLNVLVGVASVFLLVVMINYLGARHFQRFHWNSTVGQPLSPMTVGLLKSLTNQVKVVVLFNSQDPLYSPVNALLKEYRFVSPNVVIEQVDYVSNPTGADSVKLRYKLTQAGDRDLVLFECNGKTKIVYQTELSDYDYSGLISGESKEVRRTAFKGEQLFTSAILAVVDPKPPKVYYLVGHGEHDLKEESSVMGYAKFTLLLRDRNILVEPIGLGTNEVPADCQLLIVAGPRDRLLSVEVEQIEKYLTQGGRLLWMINSMAQNVGLEKTVAKWGVEVGDSLLIDPKNTTMGRDLVTGHFGNHPTVRSLNLLHLVLPRPVDKRRTSAQTADTAQVEELAFTTDSGLAVTDIRDGVLYPNPNRDRRGPISVMVAVEKGAIPGVSTTRGATRMVVVGDSYCLNNQMINNVSNRDFASQAVNWLLDRSVLLGGIGPRPIQEYKLNLTQTQISQLRWMVLAALPGSVLLFGVLVWFRRRY